MNNYSTDIFQNYILNCYIYLHHNEITTAHLLLEQQPRRCQGRSSFTFHRAAVAKAAVDKVAKQGRRGDGAGECKVGLFILEHM